MAVIAIFCFVLRLSQNWIKPTSSSSLMNYGRNEYNDNDNNIAQDII